MRPCAHLVIGMLVVLGLQACAKREDPVTPPKPAHLVEVATVTRDSVSTSHERTGTLKVRRSVRVFTQEEGRITSLPYYEGDQVKRGEPVLGLEDELLKAQLAKVQANRRQAEVDVKRAQRLARSKAISEDERVRAQTALDVAIAEERVLRARLGYTQVRAPFDAVISQRLAEPGDVVPRHSHVLTLADPSSLVTEVKVSELLIPHLKTGDQVDVRIDALGRQKYAGRILRIHPTLDAFTRQGIVEILLDPVPAGSRAGQFCRVTLQTAAVKRLFVPFRALKRNREFEYVYLLDGDHRARQTQGAQWSPDRAKR